MIDKVGNNSYTNAYSQNVVKKTSSEEAPPFLLNYDENGVVWDRSKNEEEKTIPKKKEPSNNAKTTFRVKDTKDTYEPSFTVKNEAKPAQETNANEKNVVVEILKQVFLGVRIVFKKAFDFVWYGNEKDDEKNNEKDNEKDSKIENDKENAIKANLSRLDANIINNSEKDKASNFASKTPTKEELIYDSISKNDKDEVVRLLTDNYTNMPARNTSMLTHYDKHGQIVSVNGSDEARILNGKTSINA